MELIEEFNELETLIQESNISILRKKVERFDELVDTLSYAPSEKIKKKLGVLYRRFQCYNHELLKEPDLRKLYSKEELEELKSVTMSFFEQSARLIQSAFDYIGSSVGTEKIMDEYKLGVEYKDFADDFFLFLGFRYAQE
jgi:hypothetical protein